LALKTLFSNPSLQRTEFALHYFTDCFEEPKKCIKFRTGGVCISPTWGAKTPGRIEPNFLAVGVHDVITPFKFGDDRFKGFWLAEGQILPFPIDFENRPYNTHTIL